MRLLALLLISAISLASSSAFAATLNVVGGQLMGASNVLVDGNLYDVQFLDGTCIDLFNGCDETSDFTFQSEMKALVASQALLNQVFIDAPSGAFDTDPTLTAGCSVGTQCGAFTVFGTEPLYPSGPRHSAKRAYNFIDPPSDFVSGIIGQYLNSYDTTPEFAATYAVWSSVPEPSTALLLGIGLASLAAWRDA